MSACSGDDGTGSNVNTLPGGDSGTPSGQPSGMGTQQLPPGAGGQQPGAPGGGMSGVANDGGAPPITQPVGQDAGGGTTGGPPDLGQNSLGDTFLRADTLQLKAPNLYATLLIVRTDVTADGQATLNAALTNDDDMDGFVDMNLLLRFINTKDPATGSGQVTPGGGLCPAPLDPSKACGPEPTFPFQSPPVMYTNSAQACALSGTMESAPPPCFRTTPASLTMQLPIFGAVLLQDGELVGSWSGGNITGGFVRGFLSKTVAMETKLGDGLPEFLALAGIQKGAPLSNFLSDMQLAKNARGEDGWWFLLSFTAKAAKFDPALKKP